MQHSDPLAVIETEAPKFSDAQAIGLVHRHYGLDVTVEALVSERDQNFRLQLANGREYVLKIASNLEDPQVTDFQIKALLHLQAWGEENRFLINAPRVLLTSDGETQIQLSSPAGGHVARVVTFVAGMPLAERVPSPMLCESMGAYIAHVGLALKEFRHPGSSQVLLWDMQQTLSLRRLLPHIANDKVRQQVDETLLEFEQHAFPLFAELRSQVIHSDFNPDNVLIDPNRSDEVAGVIDFGDMLRSPLIADVAIGASYLRPKDGNPLALMAEFVAGYQRVVPLTQKEIEIFFTLIKARLAASVAILYWRASIKDHADPYLAKLLASESLAEAFLGRLSEIPRESAAKTFKQICASANLSKD